MLCFFKSFPKLRLKHVWIYNIIARKPATLVCFGLGMVTKRPVWPHNPRVRIHAHGKIEYAPPHQPEPACSCFFPARPLASLRPAQNNPPPHTSFRKKKNNNNKLKKKMDTARIAIATTTTTAPLFAAPATPTTPRLKRRSTTNTAANNVHVSPYPTSPRTSEPPCKPTSSLARKRRSSIMSRASMSPGESGGNGWMEAGDRENRGGVGDADMARDGVEEGFSRISQAMVRFFLLYRGL